MMKRIKLVILLSILSLLTQQALGFFMPVNCAMQTEHAKVDAQHEMHADMRSADVSHAEHSGIADLSDDSMNNNASGCLSHDDCSKTCLMHAVFIPAAYMNNFASHEESFYMAVLQQSPLAVISWSFKPPILS